MTSDWLDDLLDREPGEPVPAGFAARLRAQLEAERGGTGPVESERSARAGPAPVLRPRFGGRLAAAAAALLMLAVGYWLGRGGPAIHPGSVDPEGPVVASAEDVLELYENRDFYGSIELLTDSSLELGLSDYAVGSHQLGQQEER